MPKSFSDLEDLVTARGLCRLCGACALICPVDVIRVSSLKAELVGNCISCGLCLAVCPVTNQRPILEPRKIWLAKPKVRPPRFKTCGVTTVLLSSLLSNDAVDGVLVSRMDRGLLPVSYLATSKEEVEAAGGANYFSSGHLYRLRDPLKEGKRLAVVGVGCCIEGVHHILAKARIYTKSLKYTVGLFCSSQLDRELTLCLLRERGISPEKIRTVNIKRGIVRIGLDDGRQLRVELPLFSAARRRGCSFCPNVQNSCADLSIGEFGAPDGHVIVAVRTEAGEDALRLAGEALDLEPAPGDVMSSARGVELRKSRSLSKVSSLHPPGWREHDGSAEVRHGPAEGRAGDDLSPAVCSHSDPCPHQQGQQDEAREH